MEPIRKDIYFPPEVICFEMKAESIICTSATRDGYGDPIEFDWL